MTLMDVGLSHYLTVAAILFTLGILGIFLFRGESLNGFSP